MNTIVKILFTVIFITHGMRSSALAQAQSGDAKACANGASSAPDQTPSDKLAQSNGVICPPNVDPA